MEQTKNEEFIPDIDYLEKDSMVVGYTSSEEQINIYKEATSFIPFENVSILDVGCGRGDLLKFILGGIEDTVRSKFSYKGIDKNLLMCDLANAIHNSVLGDNIKFEHSNFSDIRNSDETFDIIFHLLTTRMEHFTDDDTKYKEFSNDAILQSLALLNDGGYVVFFLQNDTSKHDGSVTTYNIPTIASMIPNHRYAIDNQVIAGFTKIIIFK